LPSWPPPDSALPLDENPMALHFKDFFAGRHFDLWLRFVLHDQGTGAFA
jgi:hypothetical protein